MVTFHPKHPKWDQNLQSTPQSEKTSISVNFIWESPPPPGLKPQNQIYIQSLTFFASNAALLFRSIFYVAIYDGYLPYLFKLPSTSLAAIRPLNQVWLFLWNQRIRPGSDSELFMSRILCIAWSAWKGRRLNQKGTSISIWNGSTVLPS